VWRHFEARVPRVVPVCAAFALLAACAYGVHARNQVWRDDVTLWHDVTVKSPKNGRGLMNYGLALMARGDFPTALNYFERALQYTPYYDLLEVNLGVVNGALGRDAQAERHFQRAISLGPQDANTHSFYARWLEQKGRRAEALERARAAVALNPAQPGGREMLKRLTVATSAAPPAATNLAFRTPEQWLDVSLAYYKAERYLEAIAAAQTAIYLRPGYAEAYNNVGAAYAALHLWDPAIKADLEAVRLKPDYQLARNNLAWALAQKRTGRR
jgi:tetratricopeptide (TPR) repeat protein